MAGGIAVGALYATLKLDRREFERDLKKGEQGFHGLSLASVKSAATVGLAFATMGAAIGGVTSLYSSSVNAARDLAETVSKTKVVFQDSSIVIEQMGETAAEALGISKQAAMEAASTFGNFFYGIGVGQAKAAQMSKQMVELAADLASFNNADPEDMLIRLRAGLSGEAEPLRRVGVFLTEAKVKAKAMEMGLADAHGELSEGAKILARYQIILDETKTAQGDFARTAEGLANSQRTANAELVDAQAELGESLLPFQLAITRAETDFARFTKSGIEGWQDFFLFIRDHDAWEQQIIQSKEAERAAKHAAQQAAFAVRDEIPPAMKDAATATGKFEDSLKDAEKAAQDLEDAIHDLLGEMYDETITTGDLAQARKDLNELLNEGPETKKAGDIAIYNGKVAEARQRILDLQIQIAQMQGPDAFYAWLNTTGAQIAKNNPKMSTMISRLKAILLLSGQIKPYLQPGYLEPLSNTINRTGQRQAFAEGTMSSPGGWALVGERGPELVKLPAMARVYPSAESSRMLRAGATNQYNLTVLGDVKADDEESVLVTLQRMAEVGA